MRCLFHSVTAINRERAILPHQISSAEAACDSFMMKVMLEKKPDKTVISQRKQSKRHLL